MSFIHLIDKEHRGKLSIGIIEKIILGCSNLESIGDISSD
jgi:hypothetical protein